MIRKLIGGRCPDNRCWFCRASLARKRILCPVWCLRRWLDYGYHRMKGYKPTSPGGPVLSKSSVRYFNEVE